MVVFGYLLALSRFSGSFSTAFAAKTERLLGHWAQIRPLSFRNLHAAFLTFGRILENNRVGIIVDHGFRVSVSGLLYSSLPTTNFPHVGRGCAPGFPRPYLRSRGR